MATCDKCKVTYSILDKGSTDILCSRCATGRPAGLSESRGPGIDKPTHIKSMGKEVKATSKGRRPPKWIHLLIAHILASYSTFLVLAIAMLFMDLGLSLGREAAHLIITAPLSLPPLLIFSLVPYLLFGLLVFGEGPLAISMWASYLGSLIFWSVLVRLYVIKSIKAHRRDLPDEEPRMVGESPEDGKDNGHTRIT